MKGFIFFAGFILCVGCGAAHSGQDRSGESATKDGASQGDQTVEIEDPATGRETGLRENLLGVWENASCGERKYLRSIEFKKEGKFAAVDEVAPCPEQGNCVSSGILNWEGSWNEIEGIIELEFVPIKGVKMPEKMPAMFVVLRHHPLSIGERDDHIVCPYQKRK
jgi:hypothetical protein